MTFSQERTKATCPRPHAPAPLPALPIGPPNWKSKGMKGI